MKLSRKRTGVLAISAVCLFSLVFVTRSRRERTLEGIFQAGPEQSAFFVDGDCSKKPLWFTWPGQVNEHEEAIMRAVGKPQALRLRVLAKLSPVGEHGHLGAYPREVQAIEIISANATTPCPWPGDR